MENDNERIKENNKEIREFFTLAVLTIPCFYISMKAFEYSCDKIADFTTKHGLFQDILTAPDEELIVFKTINELNRIFDERAGIESRSFGEEPICTKCNPPIHEP